jgi:hypothetical protein
LRSGDFSNDGEHVRERGPPKTTRLEVWIGYKTWESVPIGRAIATVVMAYDPQLIDRDNLTALRDTVFDGLRKNEERSFHGVAADYELQIRHLQSGTERHDTPVLIATPH